MDKPFLPWEDALQEEMEALQARNGGTPPDKKGLVGLAFSGGGIRSATFNLGVLQALWELDLLKKIDYLSTVSGGGYIGAWLSAHCLRDPGWLERPADEKGRQERRDAWAKSIQHLRRYSNYLSPEVGITSADSWSMVMVWIRNTLLVQLTVVLFLALLLLLPRLLFPEFQSWHLAGNYRWLTIALLVFAVSGIAGNQLRLSRRKSDIGILQASNGGIGLGVAAVIGVAGWWLFQDLDVFQKCGPGVHPRIGLLAAMLVGAGFFLMPFLSLVAQVFSKCFFPERTPPQQINYSQPWVQSCVVAPMLGASFFVASILWHETGECFRGHDSYGGLLSFAYTVWPFPLTVAFACLGMLAACAVRRWRSATGAPAFLAAWFLSAGALYAVLCGIVLLMHYWKRIPGGDWHAFVWGPPLVLQAISLSIVLMIGMLGRQCWEGGREWWSRLGAWLGIYSAAWLIVAVASVYGPWWMEAASSFSASFSASAVAGWAMTTAGGLLAGKSESTGGKGEKSGSERAKELLALVAPFVFIAGLLILVAWSLHKVIALNAASSLVSQLFYWEQMRTIYGQSDVVTLWAFGGCAILLFLFAWRVDINEFGLNAFYRSRLVRCYLGASRVGKKGRSPQRFTAFDDNDDEPLTHFDPRYRPEEPAPAPAEPQGFLGKAWAALETFFTGATPMSAIRTFLGGAQPDCDHRAPYRGPIHIVNCALNLGGSSDLALHTRHSAEFILTPLRCGTTYPSRLSGKRQLGFVRTGDYCGAEGTPTLGQAISVSGAAASPNMGYHTSPVVAFLMTIFNARLGWWFPRPEENPRYHAKASPLVSMRYMLAELFGMASDESNFLSISDGGHFENLAAYELVKRQCRWIIVGDAECDPELQFGSLGALIRMCEVDFGAKITIDPSAIARDRETGLSHSRCAVGTIEYKDKTTGTLIYLKASLTGREPASVLQYKASHEAFPHETTADQFYGEDQFESYRRLGFETAWRAFLPVSSDKPKTVEVEALKKLKDVWAPTLRQEARFTAHTARLMDFWNSLGSKDKLKALDSELTPRWPTGPMDSDFRAQFYTGSQMLQLMENVFLDLRFDETWDHADNAGWQAMFKVWGGSKVVKKAWELTRETYGKRFCHFCERELGLPPSEEADQTGTSQASSAE